MSLQLFDFSSYTTDYVCELLTDAYREECVRRRHKIILDDHTKEHIAAFADYLKDPLRPTAIVFTGQCGNGKTSMLYAFQYAVRQLLSTMKGMSWEIEEKYPQKKTFETPLRIVDATELIETAKNDPDTFKYYKTCGALAIEDIGKEASEVYSYGNPLAPIATILEYRYDRMLFTMMTTNLPTKSLGDKYGKRVADRLNEFATVIHFKNDSYRNLLSNSAYRLSEQ